MAARTQTSQLLEHAHAILDGAHGLPPSQAPRAAALLARQVLESAVQDLCSANGADLPRASMRSRLITLRGLAGDTLGGFAGTAWSGLSRCCHHHAYELDPDANEVRHLLNQVAALLEGNSQA